ncbi:MAG: TolB family protein [Isosphaeraceae bacterium]
MTTFAISNGLLGLVRLLATAAITAGWVHSPMSWSPDGRWLSYTVVSQPGQEARDPGWIFDTSSEGSAGPAAVASRPPAPDPRRTRYRIWASRPDGESSALIDESAWPLTAPAWSPRGKALAYGRFVPDPAAARGTSDVPWGRFEVVIQEGLNRKRTAFSMPGMKLDDAARVCFPHIAPAWSPDGQFLAFPRPGKSPTLLVVQVDGAKLVRTVIHAMLPAWSPDGSKLAYLHETAANEYSLYLLERQGQAITGPRAILLVGAVPAPFFWDEDGRSIIGLIERPGLRFPDLQLESIQVATAEELRLLRIAPEILHHGGALRGVAMDYCRDEDQCFIALDFDGRDASVLWTNPREQQFNKPIDPLDRSLKVGSVAVAPDGRAVALRFGVPGREGLSPPLIYDPVSEHAIVLAPDESARRQWMSLLVRTSRTILASSLPPATADGQAVVRPTLLPLPGEILEYQRRRLARVAGHGAKLGTGRPAPESTGGEDDPESTLDCEDRLYFDYLRGDFEAAMADLDALESGIASAGRRLAILSLRAQILWGQGELDRAREVAAYLVEAAGGPVHRVEETPLGRTLTPEADSGRHWARYLSGRASLPPTSATPAGEFGGQERDDLPPNPFAPPEAPDFPPMLRGRGQIPGMPFAPGIPRQFIRAR